MLVGKRTWYTPEVLRAVARSSISDRVHFTGFIPDEDLLLYYAASDFTVYPSFYEGFGLPIIEAMACGTRRRLFKYNRDARGGQRRGAFV